MFWKVLDVEPTTDKKKITLAYRTKLVTTNPEDKPEEFKALREAYEQALAYADNGGVSPATPIEKWVSKLEDLYNDFPSRVKVECWKELLSDDICHGLGSKLQVEEALLNFFMQKYYIPHEVWVYLNDFFGFMENLDSLYETYPKDFIDYVIVNGVSYEDTLPFGLYSKYTTEEETRDYFDLYIKVRNAEKEEVGPLLDQLMNHNLSHPYGIVLYYSQLLITDKSIYPKYEELVKQYDYESKIASNYVNELLYDKEYQKAIEVCEKALEKKETARILWQYANALAGIEEYSKAIEQLHSLFDYAAGDQRQINDINNKRSEWNVKLIEKYERIYNENPNDDDNKLSLAWALLQNERNEEAKKIGYEIVEENIDPFDYYNLLSNLDLYTNDLENGLPKLDKLIEITINLKVEDNPKNEKRRKRVAEFMSRKGYFLCANDRVQEGLDVYKEAIKENPNDVDVLTQLTRFSLAFKKYADAEMYAREIIRQKQGAYFGHYLLADALFKQNKDSESFDEVNKALDIYGSDLEGYILKLRLLIRNGAKEGTANLIKFLDDNGVGEELEILFCKGQVKEFFEDKKDEAFDIYQQIIYKLEEGKYCFLASSVYYRYVVLLTIKNDSNKKENRTLALRYIEDGLKHEPDHYGLLDYKAWYLYKDEETKKEALDIYLELETKPNHSNEVEFQLGYIYYDDLDNHVEDSLKYFLKAYELGRKDALFYISYCYYFMGQLDESEKYIRIFQEVEAERGVIDIDSCYRLSFIYEYRKQYDLALEENEKAIQKAIEKSKIKDVNLKPYYNHKVRLLRMMNRFDEAMDVIRQMIAEFNIDYGKRMITEILIQKGDYEAANNHIKKYIRNVNETSDAVINKLLVLRMTEHYKTCKLQLLNYASVIDEYNRDRTNSGIYTYELNFDKLIKLRTKQLEKRIKEDRTLTSAYADLALAYDRKGDEVNATKYALLALESYDKETPKYSLSQALNYIQLAKINTILNRLDEAEKYIELARNSTCNNCNYCACKDADIFEIDILIKKGMFDLAEKKAVEGKQKWFDEPDFIEIFPYIRNQKLKKKGN